MTGAGTAARVRRWYLETIAAEPGAYAPELEELREKVALLEGLLPLLARIVGLAGVSSIADLLPETDAEAELLLALVHGWSAAMLADELATVDVEPKPKTTGAAPSELAAVDVEPAPAGRSELDAGQTAAGAEPAPPGELALDAAGGELVVYDLGRQPRPASPATPANEPAPDGTSGAGT